MIFTARFIILSFVSIHIVHSWHAHLSARDLWAPTITLAIPLYRADLLVSVEHCAWMLLSSLYMSLGTKHVTYNPILQHLFLFLTLGCLLLKRRRRLWRTIRVCIWQAAILWQPDWFCDWWASSCVRCGGRRTQYLSSIGRWRILGRPLTVLSKTPVSGVPKTWSRDWMRSAVCVHVWNCGHAIKFVQF